MLIFFTDTNLVETIAADEDRVLGEVYAAARLGDDQLLAKDELAVRSIPLEQLDAIGRGGAQENVVLLLLLVFRYGEQVTFVGIRHGFDCNSRLGGLHGLHATLQHPQLGHDQLTLQTDNH